MKILIEDKLRALNKTNKWLSEITDIPYSTLNRLIKGEIKTLPMDEMDKICTALECTIGDIVSTNCHSLIQRKVEDENRELALKERLKLFKSMLVLKNISNSSDKILYDEIANSLEHLLNKRFINKEYGNITKKSKTFPSVEAILESYKKDSQLYIIPINILDELPHDFHPGYNIHEMLKLINAMTNSEPKQQNFLNNKSLIPDDEDIIE